jgi:hypothetical protein
MFEHGKTANTKGRPKGSQSQATIIKSRQDAAVNLLETVLRDPSAEQSLRVQAASALLTANREPTAA